jgi:hypothetical protein
LSGSAADLRVENASSINPADISIDWSQLKIKDKVSH